MDGMYTLDELTQSIIQEYDLIKPVLNFKTYRQRIRRALEEADLLDKGIRMTNPVTKRRCSYYSEFQKQTILYDMQLYDYVRRNSAKEEYRNGLRFKDIHRQIADQRQGYIEYLSTQETTNNPDSDPYISDDVVKRKKQDMMMEALFNVFFTPFNEDMLRKDLDKVSTADELHLEPADVEAQHRLDHPEGYYFKRKIDNES